MNTLQDVEYDLSFKISWQMKIGEFSFFYEKTATDK